MHQLTLSSHKKYIENAIVFLLPSKEMWPKVKTLTLKALEIDEMDGRAHTSLGGIKSLYEYDRSRAEISHKRAMELSPGNSEVYIGYATYLIGSGRTNEAAEKMNRALELDPLSILYHAYMGLPFYFARQFDKAIDQSQKTLELAPNDPLALQILGMSHAAKGMYDEGIRMLQPVRNIPLITSFIGYIYGMAGKRQEAQKILDDFLEQSKRGYFSPSLIAGIYASLGDKEKEFEWLEKAFEERDTNNWCVKVSPMFDNVHSDPRWTRLMERMGLAD